MASVDEQRRTALTLLARRDFSRGELRQRLTRKAAADAKSTSRRNGSQGNEPLGAPGEGSHAENIDQLLDDLESNGHLSDARFVESFVRGRLRRGQGPLRIRHDLAARGVDAELIDQHLTFTTEYWIARVHAIRARRFTEALPAEATDRARQARFLAQRGFPSDVIFAAFKPV